LTKLADAIKPAIASRLNSSIANSSCSSLQHVPHVVPHVLGQAQVGVQRLAVLPPVRVTRARLEQVKRGMTWAEVVRTAGGLPGDYTTGPCLEPALGNRYFIMKSGMVASVLSCLGLGDWIADKPEAYLAAAAKLASDRERLAYRRVELRDRMANSLLCDGRTFAAKLERLYRQVWQQWCVRSH
jgi:hypothetical protein